MRSPSPAHARLRRLGAVAVAALLVPAGCIGRSVPVEGAAPVADESAPPVRALTDFAATLIVENERMLDYRIYLTRQGGERLGIVRGPGRSTFHLRGVQLPPTGDLRVVAVPIAGRDPLLATAYIPRGRTARFRIMPNDAYIIVDPLPAEVRDSAATDSTRADSTAKPPRR